MLQLTDIFFLRFRGFEKSHWISMKITSILGSRGILYLSWHILLEPLPLVARLEELELILW